MTHLNKLWVESLTWHIEWNTNWHVMCCYIVKATYCFNSDSKG